MRELTAGGVADFGPGEEGGLALFEALTSLRHLFVPGCLGNWVCWPVHSCEKTVDQVDLLLLWQPLYFRQQLFYRHGGYNIRRYPVIDLGCSPSSLNSTPTYHQMFFDIQGQRSRLLGAMIIFTDEARRDYLCAQARYDIRLERRTEEVLAMLVANPYLGWHYYEDERWYPLTKPPYLIYYKKEGENFIVTGFRHARAAPRK